MTTAPFELYDYQQEALDALRGAFRAGTRNPLIALPTGCGKTVVFGTLVDLAHAKSGWRCLILAHRDELIQQAVDKLETIRPELAMQIGVVKAERNEWEREVVVASVQSLHRRRLEAIPRDHFDLIVIDEAHHAAADSYVRIARWFGAVPPAACKECEGAGCDACRGSGFVEGIGPREDARRPFLVGVTATPQRADSKALADVWDEVVYQRTILDMMAAGYLCDMKGLAVRVKGLDLDGVKSYRGDWQDGDLGEALEEAHAPEQAVEAWMEHAAGRKTLVFTPTVKLSQQMVEAFANRGVAAEHLDGTTPMDLRRAILRRLATGETTVVSNCGVLTEGFDEPSVSCVVMARPTRSKVLYVQCVGRGTRRHPSKLSLNNPDAPLKPGLLVLDLMGAATRHSLITTPRLAAEDGLDEQVVEMMEEEGLSVGEALDRQAELVRSGELVARQIDLFHQRAMEKKVNWQQAAPERWTLGGALVVERSLGNGSWRCVHKAQHAAPRLVADGVDLETAMATAETEAKRLDLTAFVNRDAAWRKRPASEGQRRALYRFGKRSFSRTESLTAGEASDELDRLIANAEQR